MPYRDVLETSIWAAGFPAAQRPLARAVLGCWHAGRERRCQARGADRALPERRCQVRPHVRTGPRLRFSLRGRRPRHAIRHLGPAGQPQPSRLTASCFGGGKWAATPVPTPLLSLFSPIPAAATAVVPGPGNTPSSTASAIGRPDRDGRLLPLGRSKWNPVPADDPPAWNYTIRPTGPLLSDPIRTNSPIRTSGSR